MCLELQTLGLLVFCSLFASALYFQKSKNADSNSTLSFEIDEFCSSCVKCQLMTVFISVNLSHGNSLACPPNLVQMHDRLVMFLTHNRYRSVLTPHMQGDLCCYTHSCCKQNPDSRQFAPRWDFVDNDYKQVDCSWKRETWEKRIFFCVISYFLKCISSSKCVETNLALWRQRQKEREY